MAYFLFSPPPTYLSPIGTVTDTLTGVLPLQSHMCHLVVVQTIAVCAQVLLLFSGW